MGKPRKSTKVQNLKDFKDKINTLKKDNKPSSTFTHISLDYIDLNKKYDLSSMAKKLFISEDALIKILENFNLVDGIHIYKNEEHKIIFDRLAKMLIENYIYLHIPPKYPKKEEVEYTSKLLTNEFSDNDVKSIFFKNDLDYLSSLQAQWSNVMENFEDIFTPTPKWFFLGTTVGEIFQFCCRLLKKYLNLKNDYDTLNEKYNKLKQQNEELKSLLTLY